MENNRFIRTYSGKHSLIYYKFSLLLENTLLWPLYYNGKYSLKNKL